MSRDSEETTQDFLSLCHGIRHTCQSSHWQPEFFCISSRIGATALRIKIPCFDVIITKYFPGSLIERRHTISSFIIDSYNPISARHIALNPRAETTPWRSQLLLNNNHAADAAFDGWKSDECDKKCPDLIHHRRGKRL